jgi:hypothetical protein
MNTKILSQNFKRGEHLEDVRANESIILKESLINRVGNLYRTHPAQDIDSDSSCESINEPSRFHIIS